MLDKELPMIPCKKMPVNLPGGEKESCRDSSAFCSAENTLARLYGDRSIAKERCLQICTQAKQIEGEELTAEIKVFKAVADVTRLKILKLLDAGLVKERKEGKWCRYSISDEAVVDMVSLAGRFKTK